MYYVFYTTTAPSQIGWLQYDWMIWINSRGVMWEALDLMQLSKPGIAPGSQICATIDDLFQSRLLLLGFWSTIIFEWIWYNLSCWNGSEGKKVSKALLKIWKCGRLKFGEMATTGPSTGIMSLPRGVRTSSIREPFNPVFRSADMRVALSHYNFCSPF